MCREYKSLETQIKELWASRGLEVIKEEVTALADGTFKWVIIAKRNKK